MNKKTLLGIFGIVALVASVFIAFTIDPVTSDFASALRDFHVRSEIIYVDSLLKDEYLPKVDEFITSKEGDEALIQKLNDYKSALSADVETLAEIITTQVDPQENSNIILDLQKVGEAELVEKTKKAIAGIGNLLPIMEKIKKDVPEELKETFTSVIITEKEVDGETKKIDKFERLVDQYNNVSPIFAGMGAKKLLRLLLIFIIALAGGVTFVLIERKARATGEIKSTEVA